MQVIKKILRKNYGREANKKVFLFNICAFMCVTNGYFCAACITTFAQGAKDYMAINKDEIINGVVKIDIDFDSGAYYGAFGVFVSENHIVTSAFDATLGYPKDIRLKLMDGDLLICVAKANLSYSNENLALLKITHYTDDLCNHSSPKLYHKQLIQAQIVGKLGIRSIPLDSPFLLKNANKTLKLEQGFPYFDNKGRFIGISSNGKIISQKQIYKFAKIS